MRSAAGAAPALPVHRDRRRSTLAVRDFQSLNLTVVTLVLGAVSFANPASANPANQFPPASNEGNNN